MSCRVHATAITNLQGIWRTVGGGGGSVMTLSHFVHAGHYSSDNRACGRIQTATKKLNTRAASAAVIESVVGVVYGRTS